MDNVDFSGKLVNGFSPLTIFAKISIVHFWLGSKYNSEMRVAILDVTSYLVPSK